MSELEPLGPIEVAQLLGVERNTVDVWRRRGLITPRWVLAGGPLYERGEIEDWARATGRLSDTNDQAEVIVPRTKVRAKHHSQGGGPVFEGPSDFNA
jgi:hypothetical protein